MCSSSSTAFLCSTASPKAPRHGTTSSRSSSRLTGACAVGSNLTMASASETVSLPCMTSGLEKRSMRFPAPLYTGFTIRISRSEGAEALSRLLSFDFDALAQRLTGSSGCKIYAPDPSMKALLESFWDIDEREPLMRLRLKALELISLVNATPCLAPRAEDYLQRSTIESLERGMRLLGSNLEQNVAVADVAEASCMGISASGKIHEGVRDCADGIPPPMPYGARRPASCRYR